MKPMCEPKPEGSVETERYAADVKNAETALDSKAKKKFRLDGFRRVLSSPAVNVVVLALAIIATVVGSRSLARPEWGVQLQFYEQAGQVDAGAKSGQRQAPASNIFGGEVYDTAIRLRETAALGMAISLTVFNEAAVTRKIPTGLEKVLPAVSQRGLIPPGVSVEGGSVTSQSSTFLIRYRTDPFQFEIVAVPAAEREGPAVMFRFPLAVMNPRSISYFRSSIAGRDNLPPPFASGEQLSEIGWTTEVWRVEVLPADGRTLTELNEERSAWSGLK